MFKLLLVIILGFGGISKTVFGQTKFRLVGGISNSNGRLEVFYNETWGTVCDDGWTNINTLIVCRSLGFISGYKIQTYPGTGSIWLDDVKCDGTERSLAECEHSSWGDNNCAHIEDISLQCDTGTRTSTEKSSSASPITLRLAGGDGRSYGRVEIFHRGQWGTICDDLWDNNDARVICRMLGYNDGIAFSGGRYGKGTGPIWIDDTQCIGNEKTIVNCPRTPWGENNCRHIEDAGVECRAHQQAGRSSLFPSTTVSFTSSRATVTPFSIRLMGGTGRNNGRVEILYQAKWGTVCDDQWDDKDAHVICTMLGYSGGTAHGNGKYGPGTGDIWLDEVNCLGNETSIVQCQKNKWGQHNCGHAEDAGVDCIIPTQQPVTRIHDSTVPSTKQSVPTTTTVFPSTTISVTSNKATVTPLSIRLMGGTGRNNGRVEILYQAKWGTVCDDQWDDKDAHVICTMLGYSGGTAHGNGKYGSGTGDIWLDEVNCLGNETSIVQCQKNNWGQNNCGHSEDAGVDCIIPTQQPFTRIDDSTVYSVTQSVPTTGIPQQTGSFAYSTVYSVIQSVPTTTTATVTPLSIRLMGGTGRNNGRVEILYQAKWGTVCDDQWDDKDAHVICTMLGYSGGTAHGNGKYGSGTGDIWLDEVNCLGNETSIVQCQKNNWGQNNCGHSEDAGVDCTIATQQPVTRIQDSTVYSVPTSTSATTTGVSIRLVGGNGRTNGRVEILYKGQWGTVCDDRWDDKEANVVCRMLGYSGGTAQLNGRYGPGTGNIWLDEVNCLGNETSIVQCNNTKWGQHNCVHSEDAGVDCSFIRLPTTQQPATTRGTFPWTRRTISFITFPTTQKPATTKSTFPWTKRTIIPTTQQLNNSKDSILVRLVGSNSMSSGRVESFYQKQWGTVGDDQWDDNDARGHMPDVGIQPFLPWGGDGISTSGGSYGPGNGRIWLDEVQCSGNEQSIGECNKNLWGRHNCQHSEDAGVNCGTTLSTTTTTQPLSIRLVGGKSAASGRVEINYNNKWGTVCHDKWDDSDARVVCRMLGYNHGIAFNVAKYGMGSGQIWLDEVNCNGTENSIADCARNLWGVHDCYHGEDAGVDCSTNAIPVIARLVGGDNPSSGRVELNLYGEWGTVCDDAWDNNDARVICRMLGYVDGISLSYGWYGAGKGKIFLDEVNCIGNETNIIDCKKNAWESHNCNHGEDAAVSCFLQAATTRRPPLNPEVSVRLAGSNSLKRGRVEIQFNGQWGTVCDDSWDDKDARVICRMLGFVDGVVSKSFPTGKGPIWLDQVECQGSELSIEQCVRNRWGIHDCDHNEDAGVNCSTTIINATSRLQGFNTSTQGNTAGIQAARLVDGKDLTVGRLEVMINNVWGNVCDDNWDDRDATVACRMLGFSSGIGFRNSKFGIGTNQIWLDDVNCTGTEMSLSECQFPKIGLNDCSHLEHAGVQCFTDANIRLTGGQSPSEGRVEIYYQNEWGSICSTNWDHKNTNVVCRMLGFREGNILSKTIIGTGTIWLSNVECDGSEPSLEQCNRNDWGVHDCQHTQDVSIRCF